MVTPKHKKLAHKAHQRAGETHLHSAGPRTIWEGNKHDKIRIDAMISLAYSGTLSFLTILHLCHSSPLPSANICARQRL